MSVLFYIVLAICALLWMGLVLGYAGSGHIGLLLASFVLGIAIFAAFKMNAWWPLGAGFAGLFVLRLVGLDPAATTHHDKGEE